MFDSKNKEFEKIKSELEARLKQHKEDRIELIKRGARIDCNESLIKQYDAKIIEQKIWLDALNKENERMKVTIDEYSVRTNNDDLEISKLGKEISNLKRWNSEKTTRILELEETEKQLTKLKTEIENQYHEQLHISAEQENEIKELKKICAPSLVKPTFTPNIPCLTKKNLPKLKKSRKRTSK